MNGLLRQLHEERLRRHGSSAKQASCDHIMWSPESYDLDVSDVDSQYFGFAIEVSEELEEYRRKHHDMYLQRLHDEVKINHKKIDKECDNSHKQYSIDEILREFNRTNRKRNHSDVLSLRSDENTSDREDESSCKSIRLNDLKIEHDKTIFESSDIETDSENKSDMDTDDKRKNCNKFRMVPNYFLHQSPNKRLRK